MFLKIVKYFFFQTPYSLGPSITNSNSTTLYAVANYIYISPIKWAIVTFSDSWMGAERDRIWYDVTLFQW